MIAQVVFNRPLNQRFSYTIPAGLAESLKVGCLVRAHFAHKEEIGCVVAIEAEVADESRAFKVLPLLGIASDGYQLSQDLLDLGRWIADYYFCSEGEALCAISQVGFSDIAIRYDSVYTVIDRDCKELPPRQRAVFEQLKQASLSAFSSLSAIASEFGTTVPTLRKLMDTGFLREDFALPRGPKPELSDSPKQLNPEQQTALTPVLGAITEKRFQVFLLHGVTGSGKTEIYLQALAEAFALGGTGLCLVPEIALTPQTVGRFEERFGEEVGVFHSQMSRTEKRLLYEKIHRGDIRLVIGARSAVFAPLPNLRFIIIDEEHEGSYKQSETPRYHARDVAILRAQRLGIPIVLGSATPSLESFENARREKYTLLELRERVLGLSLPGVKVVHLGQKLAESGSPEIGLLSDELRAGIRQRLDKGEQSLLFLNRRGFSNFLMCMSCRWVARCDDDDVAMTIHRRGGMRNRDGDDLELDLFPKPLQSREAMLKCHFCGHTNDYPKVCPECGSDSLAAIGSGTQRIEEVLAKEFPEAKVLRLDQDTISTRQAFLRAWQEMVSGEAQIILGTQMIAKGLHLERVTLVGVILADVGLFIPDFRAEEKTFSLLMQVSGRAGRANAGEVLFQTYLPRHPSIQMAAAHDYHGFFKAEMVRRERARFPPCEKIIAITISDVDPNKVTTAARQMGAILRRQRNFCEEPLPAVLGPLPAPLTRLGGRFRYRLLIRGANHRENARLLRRTLHDNEWKPAASLRIAIDVDPQDLL